MMCAARQRASEEAGRQSGCGLAFFAAMDASTAEGLMPAKGILPISSTCTTTPKLHKSRGNDAGFSPSTCSPHTQPVRHTVRALSSTVTTRGESPTQKARFVELHSPRGIELGTRFALAKWAGKTNWPKPKECCKRVLGIILVRYIVRSRREVLPRHEEFAVILHLVP